MGFDTYLTIGERTAMMWRKYASPLPRLLFKHDQLVVKYNTAENAPTISVTYEATVSEVLGNLDAAGLGWHATLAAYSEVRSDGMEGAIMGIEGANGASDAIIRSRVEAFITLLAEADLTALGTLLAYQWNDPEIDDVIILSVIQKSLITRE